MPKVVAEYKTQARARILEGARAVFRRNGLAGSTMDDIAREIGVSKGALYLYFRTKSELLTALQTQFRQEVLGKWEGLLEKGDVAEAIADSLQSIISGEMDPAIWHELLMEAYRDPKIRAALDLDQREDAKKLRQFLLRLAARGRIRPLEDPSVVTDVVLTLLQGAATQFQMKARTRETHRKLVRSLRYVLAVKKPPGRRANAR
jgi:TetR/AcrR family transcriptional regulator, repressor for uid operon